MELTIMDAKTIATTADNFQKEDFYTINCSIVLRKDISIQKVLLEKREI